MQILSEIMIYFGFANLNYREKLNTGTLTYGTRKRSDIFKYVHLSNFCYAGDIQLSELPLKSCLMRIYEMCVDNSIKKSTATNNTIN